MSVSAVAASRQHHVRTPDGRIVRAYETGDPQGELIVVHHGTPGCGLLHTQWADDAVARGIRLVSYDRPGYGGSDRHDGHSVADAAADTAAVADALGSPRFRIWGGSGGGPYTLACAALLPDRVIAAALVGSVAPRDAADLDWTAGMGQDNIDEFAAASAGEQILSTYLRKVRDELTAAGPEGISTMLESILPAVDAALLAGDWGNFLYQQLAGGLATSVDGWVDDDLALGRPWGFELSQISIPIRLIHGRLDVMVPFPHGEWLAHHVPNVTADLLDMDGHLTTFNRIPDLHAWLLEQ